MSNQQQDLTQEILNRLDTLAAQLGTTVEYLWPALVREQAALGWAHILLVALFACLLAVAYRGWWRAVGVTWPKEDEWSDRAGMRALIGFGVLVVLALSCIRITESIAQVIAPEAAALRGLLP